MIRRLAPPLVALLLAAGCGIQPTGVVPAGSGPYLNKQSAGRVSLYFLRGGKLAPVLRFTGSSREVGPQNVLAALFAGPTAQERAEGYSSLLPTGQIFSAVDTTSTPVTVRVPTALPDDVPARLGQVVCTTIAALVAGGRSVGSAGVDVVAIGTTYHNRTCRSA
ncbi:hypothetical protein VSH64_07900 [Amycolatopsis rhabdoformis]|uniref:GerMN domain-containing protein n=1 Tax=Amycolatopsis rhabdoformis TaxID=1448059 RepID=A0ABZ1IC73_9PSEU|nr:hypothetical protein [Amycolatopsis rhabdoformis]WSE32030.1 hypothetical protein VSH64_07900 [Amycolatopsis rhabdoformis]